MWLSVCLSVRHWQLSLTISTEDYYWQLLLTITHWWLPTDYYPLTGKWCKDGVAVNLLSRLLTDGGYMIRPARPWHIYTCLIDSWSSDQFHQHRVCGSTQFDFSITWGTWELGKLGIFILSVLGKLGPRKSGPGQLGPGHVPSLKPKNHQKP